MNRTSLCFPFPRKEAHIPIQPRKCCRQLPSYKVKNQLLLSTANFNSMPRSFQVWVNVRRPAVLLQEKQTFLFSQTLTLVILVIRSPNDWEWRMLLVPFYRD